MPWDFTPERLSLLPFRAVQPPQARVSGPFTVWLEALSPAPRGGGQAETSLLNCPFQIAYCLRFPCSFSCLQELRWQRVLRIPRALLCQFTTPLIWGPVSSPKTERPQLLPLSVYSFRSLVLDLSLSIVNGPIYIPGPRCPKEVLEHTLVVCPLRMCRVYA